MSHVLRSYLRLVFVLMACAALSLAAFAQSTTDGAVSGVVADPTKAVVVGAKVTVHNIDTNATETATTDAQGHFRVGHLQPGNYTVQAEAPNFAPSPAYKVIVEVGLVSSVDVNLSVAGKQETVEVQAEAPVVNTEQQDFNANVNQASINNLPINGRRWSNFALLTPGAAPDGGFGLISFRGISGLMNNSTVDGGDNNQAFFGEERGRTRTQYIVSQASVREFQVNTSNYSAEYGRAAGAVVNTVTKSGTNKIHGEGFWYIRDNGIGATNPFTKLAAKNADGGYDSVSFKPDDRRQQFGFNIGGPIVKDKLFFFFNYDGQRQNFPGVALPNDPGTFLGQLATQPYDDEKTLAQHLYSVPLANCSSSSTVACYNTSSGKYFGPITAEQRAGAQAAFATALDFFAATTGEVPRNSNQNIFFPKLDWRLNQNHTLTLSYNRMRRDSLAGVQQGYPVVNRGVQDWGNDYVKVDMLNVRLSSALGNTVSNELRYSWGRDFEYNLAQPMNPAEAAYAATATVPNYLGYLPETGIGSGNAKMTIGAAYYVNRYSYPDERRHQFSDSVTWVHGKHLFKFGTDVNRVNDLMNHLYEGNGSYSYSNRLAFIEDLAMEGAGCVNKINGVYTPSGCYSGFYQTTGPSAWKFTTWDIAGFIQDSWRVSPRLTLNLGVRYEYELLPASQASNDAVDTYMGYGATSRFPTDRNNFGPRVGLAWDMFGDGKTSLRAGYGMYFGRIINSTIMDALTKTGSPDAQSTYAIKSNNTVSGTSTPLVEWPNVLPQNPSQPLNVVFFGPHVQTPQIHQADIILEHEFAKNTVLSVSYLMSMGREMLRFFDTNLAPSIWSAPVYVIDGPFAGKNFSMPIYSSRNNPAFAAMTQIRSDVNSNYNALVVQLNRRMTNGLQFQSSYTWSHALDTGQSSTTFSNTMNVFDPYNPGLEYGTSSFDYRHRIVGSLVWEPQYFRNSARATKAILDGWVVAPIFAFSSGQPYYEGVSGYPTLPSDLGYAASSFNESGGTSRLAYLVQRNNWRYPWLQNVDLRLARKFRIKEGQSLEVVAEAFNLFNHMNVSGVNTSMYSAIKTSDAPEGYTVPSSCTTADPCTLLKQQVDPNGNPTFGLPNQAASNLYRERQIQFALRYSF